MAALVLLPASLLRRLPWQADKSKGPARSPQAARDRPAASCYAQCSMVGLARRRPEPFVGAAGILFVVLYVVPAIIWGGVRPDDPAAAVTNALTAHRSAAIAAAYLLLAASVMLLVFAAGVSRSPADGSLSELLSRTAFGAGAISAALLAAANGLLGALGGYIIVGSSPEIVRALNGSWDAFTTVSGLFLGVFALTLSLREVETRYLSRWLRWLGVVAGAVLIIGSGSLATPFHGVGPLWVLGVFGTLGWIALSSIWMLWRA